MIIYSASTIFYKGNTTVFNYPAVATEQFYSSVESVLDFCEIAARQSKEFPVSDTHISCVKCQILEDGSVVELESKTRSFKNYKH